MNSEKRRVVELIETAFRDVTLGNGIGLRQGEGLDDYADEKTLAEYRSKDEKDDWSRISVEELNCCSASLSFFDAEGMRFHLPAFLIADLEGTFRREDVLFLLTYSEHDALSHFTLLSKSQRHAVREYLLLRLANAYPDEIGFIGPRIEKALAEYWTD
jgi:hypothetical protein